MTYYNEQLQKLQEQAARNARLKNILKDLRSQRNELDRKVIQLEVLKEKEQADVDKLTCGSLAAFFYKVAGKQEEKLYKERKEAYEAAVKYDVAARELAAVCEDIKSCERELSSLRGCEERYAQVLQEKKDAIKSSGTPEADEILKLEEQIANLQNQRKEINEAISAGRKAVGTADNVLSALKGAKEWGTFDMLGGGIMADVGKYSAMDKAQKQVEQLQVELRRFKTELTDVTIQADLQVKVDGFLRFADYFLDGLFIDWKVYERIKESQGQVQKTRAQTEEVLNKLTSMLSAAEREMERAKTRLDGLVLKAQV